MSMIWVLTGLIYKASVVIGAVIAAVVIYKIVRTMYFIIKRLVRR